MSKKNVIVVYWAGEFKGVDKENRDYSPKDVWNLYKSVKKHLSVDFNFYVLTNDLESEYPGQVIPLIHNWPGWWSKMELFREDLPPGRYLYIDLDAFAIRSLNPLFSIEGNLVMFRGRTASEIKPKIIDRYRTSVMMFDAGGLTRIYAQFKADPEYYMDLYRSDQDLIGGWLPNQPTFPMRWLCKLHSFKKSNKAIPMDAIVVTGRPANGLYRRLEEIPGLLEMAY